MKSLLAAAVLLVAVPSPAAAAVTYDPDAKTGSISRGDVLAAFGWTDPELASHAAGLEFRHDFWTDDTYAATCAGREVPMVHHKAFGHYELALASGRGAAAGYGGFRLTGAVAGISGTSVPPGPGQLCPGGTDAIETVRLVSTSDGWALTVDSDGVRKELLRG